MKKLPTLCAVVVVSLMSTTAFALGGMGQLTVTGGAFGTSAATPGTNSLGTALSSSGHGTPRKGPLFTLLFRSGQLPQPRTERTFQRMPSFCFAETI